MSVHGTEEAALSLLRTGGRALWRRRGRYRLHFLKTRATQDRSALGRTEGHGGLFTTRRALGARLSANPGAAAGPLGLALFAALGIVFELFVVKKQLLAGGEDELFPAINAFQNSISEFHGRLPRTQGNVLNRPCQQLPSRSLSRSSFPTRARAANRGGTSGFR